MVADGEKRPRGRPRKSVEEHIANGTYRRDRHGALQSDLLQFRPKPTGKIVASAASQSKWCRNEADYRAVAAGFRFNEALAAHIVEFFPKFLRHSMGEWYGQPFELTAWQATEVIYPLFGWVGPDGLRRFRYSYTEIPKKNYKSTTASGIGLYMLVADEEPAAQIYSLGADKDQARIVHREAINMVEASPDLDAILKINRTTGAIVYPGMRAFYQALSASPRGKHGINIHCAVADELHEWYGDELWNAIKYGYRARRQPLQLVITNAGDDQQSVCYGQRKKAEAILAGTQEDHRFFALIKSVSQEDAEGEIAAVKEGAATLPVAKRCNPGLGHVIKEETLLADIRDAIANPKELRNLLRLTYGVWVTGRDPYLDMDRWAKCQREFSEADLLGRSCAAAVDASQRDDLCALALVFPGAEEDEEQRTYRQLVYHWLPSATVHEKRHIVDYATWARDGWLTVIPNETVIPLAWVRKTIVEIAAKFDLQMLLYDPMYFEPTAEVLRTEDGIDAIKFPQTIMHFAGPTRAMRLLVNSGRLEHSGNPLLTWQIGHTETKTDPNHNERPVKPDDREKKIDGVVASIMALDGAMRMAGVVSAYKDRGVFHAADLLRDDAGAGAYEAEVVG